MKTVTMRRWLTEAGREARMRTLAVGYQLAPEHPFPAAHEDALAAGRAFVETSHRVRHTAHTYPSARP